MTDRSKPIRLETEAIVVGYAMSRLDGGYLIGRDCETWKDAFSQAADALQIRATSLKNLRDEFDPYHDNARRGWHKRALRSSRQRVLDELSELSNDALLELTSRILARDQSATVEAIDVLAGTKRVVHNVAQRLLTGRLAEEFFLANSLAIAGIQPVDLLDFRLSARGFDFGLRGNAERAFEIKGISVARGEIVFTDREWSEAKCRRADYWLVVVGNLSKKPAARVIHDPWGALTATCITRTSVTASWRSRVRI